MCIDEGDFHSPQLFGCGPLLTAYSFRVWLHVGLLLGDLVPVFFSSSPIAVISYDLLGFLSILIGFG